MSSAANVVNPPGPKFQAAIHVIAAVFKWLGRGFALVLFLGWGAFLIGHVNAWYLQGSGVYPPAWVLWVVIAHLGLVVGLGFSLRWSGIGSVIIVLATAAFCGITAYHTRMTYIMLINLVPVGCFVCEYVLSAAASKHDQRKAIAYR